MVEIGVEESTVLDSLPNDVRERLEERSNQIRSSWKHTKNTPPLRECWHPHDGDFVREALGDDISANETHIPIEALVPWARNRNSGVTVTDRLEGRTASLYNGLRHIQTDATSILEALLDLSHTSSLYKIPLITPVAIACVVEAPNNRSCTWKIRIGVYMNRLLPEVLTASTLHVVMSSLDKGSFIVSEALHVPPMRDLGDPVFVSAKYPIVRVPGKDEIIEIDIDEDDMSVEEEKKEADSDKVMDAATMGASRDSRTISPFTTNGLLKLLESPGNDMSEWPDVAESLRPYLQLELMLHQQHAVCWMRQMESLGGLGINSILWEERQFLDGGGKYYYSPALGQIRLGKPPSTVGGILSDMMGLGKTLEVLCLIVSTLQQLKDEAREGGDGCTHATLLILPPALVAQWRKEIEKSCGDTLKVALLDAHAKSINEDIVVAQGEGPDILITTYGALEATRTSKFLASWQWGRVVLDEMQEIRSSTTKIARNCDALTCQRRWLVSGTPIFEGISDLRGELNFLCLEPYAAKLEDGFFDFSITNHWNTHSEHGLETLRILGLLVLRRSKDMTIARTGQSIMEQKKLTVEFVPVSQEPSERALYCWMEHIVSEELKQKFDGANDLKSRDLCLRVLRELCFTPCLLNGGMGVSSQLKTLNTLMVRANRRAHSGDLYNSSQTNASNDDRPRKRRETIRIMSCDEALRFLTQVQAEANVGDDFVSDVNFGRGGGATNRAHAMDSVEDQIQEAQSNVDAATNDLSDARRKRAKAHWHYALEMVTTGALSHKHKELGVAPKFSNLWRWRCAATDLAEQSDKRTTSLPEVLTRGWRPKETFQQDLYSTNPTFAWVHPFSLRLDYVPEQVAGEDIKTGVSKAIGNASVQLCNISSAASSESQSNPTWAAWLQFSSEEDVKLLIKVASSKTGLEVESNCPVPHIEAGIEKATEDYANAKSENNVYPCPNNKKREVNARKALQQAQLGLRIRHGNPSGGISSSPRSIVLSRALGPARNMTPRSSSALIESYSRNIAQSSYAIERNAARLEAGRNTIDRLMPALNTGLLSQEVAQLSAFDTLEALKDGEFHKTRCPICLSSLGPIAPPAAAVTSSAPSAASAPPRTADEPVVAMTHCSHFFCIDCLEQHVQTKLGTSRKVACPNCRRPFCPSSEVIHIDHTNDDSDEQLEMREKAKSKVREASDMLESSNGVIDGGLWHSLFLSIDVPVGVSRRAHPIHTALPRDVLAHLRAATGMDLDCPRSAMPQRNEHGLSSKVQALLRDLPSGEHSVLFSASKDGVLHMSTVLQSKNIPCFSLYVGQNTIDTAKSVNAWETMECDETKTGPVLVVQAGAAASGLTLTAASKLFLMEPFSRQEEEMQAYARCHRYGQKNNVHVKVYYVPVSVESRLLEWRKRAANKITATPTNSGANYVFTELFEEDSDDEDSDDGIDMVDLRSSDETSGEEGNEKPEGDAETSQDHRRTQFLLGLVDADGNPIGPNANDEETAEDDDGDRKISARRFVLD